MAGSIDREKERNDEATGLVDLTHLFLHLDEGQILLTWWELCDMGLNAIFLLASLWVLLKCKVALGVNMRAINDQRLSVLEAFRYVKVAAVAHSLALTLVFLNHIFIIHRSFRNLRLLLQGLVRVSWVGLLRLLPYLPEVVHHVLHNACLQDVRHVDLLSELGH